MATLNPHISVVIPVYNEQEYIESCLDAISKQTLKPDEIFIVDNNCTDETIRRARKYPGVHIVKETKQGICAATKAGLDAAAEKGGIVLRCDADSQPSVNWVAEVVEHLQSHPKVIAVTGPGVVYDTNKLGKILFSYVYMKPYFALIKLALGTKPLFGSNFAIRASAWKNISHTTHLADHQDIHDDIDISYHALKHGVIQYMPSLYMPISVRPFRSPASMPKRYMAGFRSVFIHWPQQAPWKRYIK